MKRRNQFVMGVILFLLIIVALISSVQIVAYGDSEYKFYQKLYEKYTVVEDLDMQMDDVMHVTKHMMAYLIGQEEELSIIVPVDGKEQDFFNEQDRLHMADVRNLFIGGLQVRTICVGIIGILVVLLITGKAEWKKLLVEVYGKVLGLFAGILLFVVLACCIDFTACFTIFHKIFFTNDLWLFDPATDYMIRMLPEGFFVQFAARIVEVFVAFLVVLTGIVVFVKRKISSANKNI